MHRTKTSRPPGEDYREWLVNSVRASVEDTVRNPVRASVMDTMRAPVSASVSASVRASIRRAL
jgi:hypothetical protein